MSTPTDSPLVEIANHVREAARQGRKVAAIFDLDSTLFNVSPRIQHILRTLGNSPEFAAKYSEAARILKDIEVLPTDWGVRTVLQRSGFPASPEMAREIRDYWRQHFFASHHLDKDHIYPSANEYVNHLHTLGADILYLTGRNEGAMKDGTLKALKHWGFPFFQESKLFMKPSDIETDENYKAHVLRDLVHSYDQIWFFENEPVIIELVRAQVPQVHIVFVKSTHAGRAADPTDLRTIGMSYSDGVRKI